MVTEFLAEIVKLPGKINWPVIFVPEEFTKSGGCKGRINAVADVYDALSTERPYKPAFAQETVLEIMLQERGTHFLLLFWMHL